MNGKCAGVWSQTDELNTMRCCCLFLFFSFGVPFFVFAKTAKVLPSYLQKAYVIQKSAIVYTRPNFDSIQINNIPAGSMVTISRKIYRPKNRFGTFYRIYVNKPKKLRAYISEIDVVPRYMKSGSKFKTNPEFSQVKKKLKYIKDFQFNNADSEDIVDMSDRAISEIRLIGLIVSYAWLAYKSKSKSIPTWLFGIKLSGPGLPINRVATDINLVFSLLPPIIENRVLKKGYQIFGDLLFKLPLIEGPNFLFHIGGGFMVKFKGSLAPEKPSFFEIGGGIAGSTGLTVKIHDRLAFLAEGKLYYDLLEEALSPAILGGLMVIF